MDVRTVYLIFIIINFGILGVATFVWFQNKKYFKGIFWWIIGLFTQQIGMIFIIGYETLPKFVSVGLSNALFVFTIPIYIYVIGMVSKIHIPNRSNFIIASLSTAGIFYFTLLDDRLIPRVVLVSCAMILYSGFTLYKFIREKIRMNYCRGGIAILTFVLLGLIFLVRLVYYVVEKPEEGAFYLLGIELFVSIGVMVINVLLISTLSLLLNGVYLRQMENHEKEVNKVLDKTKKLAQTDELTGIANRRYFNSVIFNEMKRSNRYGGKLALILVDIDLFKNVNDSYGHDVGDKVLVKLAKTLKDNIRHSDMVARWGGEEFAVILTESDMDIARIVAEKLRNAVENMTFDQAFRITASFGLAERLPGESYSSWFKKADNAMFDAKNNGRNRVEYCDAVYDIEEKLKSIHFDENYISGIKSVDEEHEALVNQLRRIYQEEGDYTQMLDQVKLLIDLTEEHFNSEEKVMMEEEFPYIDNHKIAHEELLDNAKRLIDGIRNIKDISSKSVAYVLQELVIEHMINEDSEFMEYIKNKKTAGP